MDKAPSKPILKLEHLTKSYGKDRGIADVDLSVFEGEVFGFMGPNGAGKSTTINCILDLLHPTSGRITVFGLDAQHDTLAVHERIAYLSGDMMTDPSLTGAQYLTFVRNMRSNIDKKLMQELTTRLRCETTKRIKSLSRGNRQKIGLVAALMHDPDLLILDEPTSGLDPLVQNEFNEIIRERKARGKTTFISSHVLSEVQAICDRVGFIRDGKLISVSQLDDLLRNAPRRINVLYRDNAPDSQLKKLAGIRQFHASGRQRSFTYAGDYNELLRILNMKHIDDLQMLEPQLDEVFMEYYQTEETKHV